MRSGRVILTAAAIAAGAFLAPSRAAADEGIDVSWVAPEGCPSSAELRRRVGARLPNDAVVRVRGRVEKRGARYRVALEIATATAAARGERVLDASTCEELASSAAVVIAISVAPAFAPEEESTLAAAPASTESPPPAAPQPPPPAPASAPTSASASASERAGDATRRADSESPARFLARAHVAGDSGLLPVATVGGGLAFGFVVVRDLSIEAGASLWASQDGTVEGAPARGASFGLFSAGARACWALTHGIEIAPCIGAEIARISASGFGAATVADAASLTWGPEVILSARIPVYGPISVRAGIGGFAPISRQSFVINAAGTVHRAEPIAIRTLAGPEVRF